MPRSFAPHSSSNGSSQQAGSQQAGSQQGGSQQSQKRPSSSSYTFSSGTTPPDQKLTLEQMHELGYDAPATSGRRRKAEEQPSENRPSKKLKKGKDTQTPETSKKVERTKSGKHEQYKKNSRDSFPGETRWQAGRQMFRDFTTMSLKEIHKDTSELKHFPMFPKRPHNTSSSSMDRKRTGKYHGIVKR
ncbi:MAG: hypothetical protein M1828_005101 [Chrysothrix sp. TS-e1954]|nr:MAG: hypothetical protein M1828_005101 [Chrysothrix sp. TS-e1954]